MSNIHLKINKKLNLQIPKFVCDDNPLQWTHLNSYPMLQHFNAYSFDCYCGKPASGKTSLLISFLTGKGKNKVYRKCFNHVYVIMPTSSRESMQKNPFQKHDPEKLYDELTFDIIEEIYNKLLNSSSEKENSLLILDDVTASLKSKEIQKIFRSIIYNRRHLKCKIIILVQSYQSIPREIRKIINNIVIFKPAKIEFEILIQELISKKKNIALELLKFYEQKHDYLMLNVDSQRIYKNFDEIIINENNI